MSPQPTGSGKVPPFQSRSTFSPSRSSKATGRLPPSRSCLPTRNLLRGTQEKEPKSCQAPKSQITAPIQHIRVAYQLSSNRYTNNREAKEVPEQSGPLPLTRNSFIHNIL